MPEPGRFCNGPPASFRGNPRNSLRDSAGSAAGSARQAGRRLEKRTGSASKRRNRSCPCRAQPCAPAPPRRRRTTCKAFGCRSPPIAPSRQRPRLIARAKDMHYYTPEGRRDPRCHGGPVVLQCRAQSPADRRGDPGAGGRARFRPDLPVRASERVPGWRRAWPSLRPAISTTCSSAIPDPKPPTRR